MSVEIGKPAPDFTLPTDGGGRIRLKDRRGKKLVLFALREPPREEVASGASNSEYGRRFVSQPFS